MRLLHLTTSLCRTCQNGLPARVLQRGDAVWLEKDCPEHGHQALQISPSVDWYERTRTFPRRYRKPAETKHRVDLGCPFDCGPCDAHEAELRMPVVTITSSCNLDCPICYVHNKNEGAFHMSLADFKSVLTHVKARRGGHLDLLNMTGGEPMLHPKFLDMLELAHAEGVSRITVCSNGLKLRDEVLVSKLAGLGARVALSFDSFEPAVDEAMQGISLLPAKLRALDLLEKHGVDVTLIPVMTQGYNDQEIGKILEMAMSRPNIRHVEVHTMTYTGQGGVSFDRSGRISMFEVLERISAQTGYLAVSDFVPSPAAHPLCYQIAYLLLDPNGGPPTPFLRFLDASVLYDALSEHLYLEPGPALEEALRDAIDRLWLEDTEEAARTLRGLKRLLAEVFPVAPPVGHDPIRAAERCIKAIYVHSHMDEDNFDTERLAACCDSNCYPDGSTIPVCAYNVLYRDKESNFMSTPRSWGARTGGHLTGMAK